MTKLKSTSSSFIGFVLRANRVKPRAAENNLTISSSRERKSESTHLIKLYIYIQLMISVG